MPGVAIVTGASRGIGKASALALAEAGHAVVICARSQSDLEATAAEVRARGGRATAVVADVASEDDLKRLVAEARRQGESIDVLVNNAGVSPKPRNGRRTPVVEMTTQEWNEVMTTNLTSSFILAREVGKLMCSAKRGSIISISSVSVRVGGPSSGAHYVASKAGMSGLTKALAREFAPFGVRANAIAAGSIATVIGARSKNALEADWVERTIPLGRQGEPREIADLVVFLASDRSSYITGCTMDATGGWTMT